jgi:multidrug resistance protein, MATE family
MPACRGKVPGMIMELRSRRKWALWTGEIRPTLGLALPMVAGMVGHMLIGIADTMMVGRVGVVPLAAASFVNTVSHLPFVFAVGLLSSMAVLTSRAFGGKDNREAGEVLRHGILIAAGAGVLIVLGMVALRPFLFVFGQPPDVVEASGTYLLLVGASMLPALIGNSCKTYSEALNHPWTPTLILLGSVLLNIFLNWILIFGHWGAPAMGLNGAGWATLLSRWAMAGALILFAAQAPIFREFKPLRWTARLSLGRFRALFTLGWPVGIQHLLEVSAFSFAALMMGWISAEAIAAHQIAMTCAATTFMFSFGIGMAICIRVGHAWGARRYPRMRRIGFVGITMAAVTMGLFAILFIMLNEQIAALFVVSPVVVALAARLLVIAALFQVADGVQVVAISALRGQGDVRVPALIAVLAYWILAVPLGYLLGFGYQLGAAGIWIGLATGLAVAALFLSWRFHERSRSAAKLAGTEPGRSGEVLAVAEE